MRGKIRMKIQWEKTKIEIMKERKKEGTKENKSSISQP